MVPFAVLPLVVGLCLLFGGDRRFLARFTPAAVEIARPAQSIPYASILEVRPIAPLGASRPRSFPIEVVHQQGSVMFPATLSAPSERVYAFLRGQLPETAAARPAGGAGHLSARAGAELRRGPRLLLRRPARALPPRRRRAGARSGKGLLITAVFWAVLAFVRPGAGGWYAGAGLAAGHRRRCAWSRRGAGPAAASTRTRSSGAALVISPLGLAMEQGPLNGHLTWQQIRKVSVQVPGKGITVTRTVTPGIAVEVEGATFVITDSYDRPLSEIHERIVKYWR